MRSRETIPHHEAPGLTGGRGARGPKGSAPESGYLTPQEDAMSKTGKPFTPKEKKKGSHRLRNIAVALCVVAAVGSASSRGSRQESERIYAAAVDLTVSGAYEEALEQLEEKDLSGYKEADGLARYLDCLRYAQTNEESAYYYDYLTNELQQIQFEDDGLAQHLDRFSSQILDDSASFDGQLQAVKDIEVRIGELSQLTYEPQNLQDVQSAVETARREYDSAPPVTRERVSNLSELEEAEQRTAELQRQDEENRAEVQRLVSDIDQLGAVTLDSKDQLDKLQAARSSIPSYLSGAVTNSDQLDAALLQYTDLQAKEEKRLADEAERQKKLEEEKKNQSSTNKGDGWKDAGNGKQPSVSDSGQTVYWVKSGKVYHSTPDCASLSRSKNIRSGTISQSGKPRGCKNCC